MEKLKVSNAFSGGWEWRESGIILISTAQCGKGGPGGQIGRKLLFMLLASSVCNDCGYP